MYFYYNIIMKDVIINDNVIYMNKIHSIQYNYINNKIYLYLINRRNNYAIKYNWWKRNC